MKHVLSLLIGLNLVVGPAFAAPSTDTPARPGVFERAKLRVQIAWWKALLFEMRKNDGLLRQFGTGNGPSGRNLIVAAANSSVLPLAYTTLRFRRARQARKVAEARSILADFERGLSGMERDAQLIAPALREAETFTMTSAAQLVASEERAARWAHKLRYVRRVAIAGLVAAFVFDAGATWIQVAMEPGRLDEVRGRLEEAIDEAELRLNAR